MPTTSTKAPAKKAKNGAKGKDPAGEPTNFAKKGDKKIEGEPALLTTEIRELVSKVSELTKQLLEGRGGSPYLCGDFVLVNGIPVPCERMRLSREQNRLMLGWEDEEAYKAKDKATTEPKDFGENYDLVDTNGIKVRMHRNQGNRPFKQGHCEALAQDLLNGNWAGFLMGPGFTVNGETIIYDQHGDCESGQHREIAYEWAWQLWEKVGADHPWKIRWPEGPVLESLVVQGISADSRVKRTLDNVMPRSVADVFYTSDIFGDLLPSERRELAGMLGAAVDMLWRRTGKAKDGSKKVAQTHSESVQFVEDHGGKRGRLVRCVKHLWECNGGSRKPVQLIDPATGKPEVDAKGKPVLRQQGRAISEATGKLTAGKCAALMWLMAASVVEGEDADVYWQDPEDKNIPWDDKVEGGVWDKAVSFWATLGDTRLEALHPLRQALASLVSYDDASGGREMEKIAVLAKAWADWREDRPVTFSPAVVHEDGTETPASGSCWLEYHTDENGQRHIVESPFPNFGGIDQFDGPPRAKDSAVPNPEELEEAAAKEREEGEARLQREAQARVEKQRAAARERGAAQPPLAGAPEGGEKLTAAQILARKIHERRVAMQQAEEDQGPPPAMDDGE